MVELTSAQRHLIKWLKVMGVEEDEMVGIMLLMDTPEKRDKLMMWMSKNEEATPSDILGKAMEISRKAESRTTIKQKLRDPNLSKEEKDKLVEKLYKGIDIR